MTEYQKLKRIIDATDELIKKDITTFSPEFRGWDTRVERYIARQFGTDSIEMKRFKETPFIYLINTDYMTENEVNRQYAEFCRDGLRTTKAILETYLEEIKEEEDIMPQTKPPQTDTPHQVDLSKIFIVHGHDGELKEAVARLIEKQQIKAIILSEQANTGNTIIEKFEKNSDVGCAICLFTADDVGKAKGGAEYKSRARQNVVFEAGFFIGKLGRDHIVILSDSGIEIPSDLAGVVYTSSKNWQLDLLKELNAMGYSVDLNKLLD